MTDAYAIANKDGTVKHLAVWHHNATGPSPLCGQTSARTVWDRSGNKDDTVLFASDPSELDKRWCSRCELRVEAMVRAVAHG